MEISVPLVHSFHPNRTGQAVIARRLSAMVLGQSS
jgi:hypothetical protein